VTGQLFYAWLSEEADSTAKMKGEAVIAGIRSDSVVVREVEGGYAINVRGLSFKATEAEARIVATILRNEGGFKVGRNFPAGDPTDVQPAIAPRKPRRPARTTLEPRAKSMPFLINRFAAHTPTTSSNKPETYEVVKRPQAAHVLKFMQCTYMHYVQVGFLASRLHVSTALVKSHLRTLIEQGYVEQLSPRVYRLTESGREASVDLPRE
jgi:hypothetical protein